MPLPQPTTAQYLPRGNDDIERRLRRLERQAGSLRFGSFAEYTPQWWTSGSAPSIGNGQLKAYAARASGMALCRGTLKWGSTTNGGTGTWYIGLPSGVRPFDGPHYDTNPAWSLQAAGRVAVITSTVHTGGTVAHPDYTNGTVHGVECLVINIASPWDAAASASASWPVSWAAGNILAWQALVRTG